MKIVERRVPRVARADPPLFSSYGLHAPYALRTVVELVSEDGLAGAAETHGGERTLADLERVRGEVVGRDAFDLARLRQAVEGAFGVPAGDAERGGQTYVLPGEGGLDTALRVYGVLEVAALDLIG